jgi:hypothetical protein
MADGTKSKWNFWSILWRIIKFFLPFIQKWVEKKVDGK